MVRPATIALVISLIISTTSAQCTLEAAQKLLKRALYEFNSNFITRLDQETESHFVLSGVSSWSLISAMSFGATDVTLAEINQVLRLHPHKCFNSKFFETLQLSRAYDDNLERSSAIFVDDEIAVYEKFKTDVWKAGVTDVDDRPLEDPASAAVAINNYVKEATNDTIEEIVTFSDLEGVNLIMIDAMHFKSTWKVPFSQKNTETSAFYNHRGNQIGDVNLMFTTGLFNLTTIDLIKATVIELPYGDGTKYSKLIFLPYTDVSVTSVIDNMNRISMVSILNMLKQERAQIVAVQIPRFKLKSNLSNLKELLIDMGLRTMFDSLRAKFPKISDHQTFLANFIQKSEIEITEEETVAEAVSPAVFELRKRPKQFIANKPFLFMIVDKYLEAAIFTGAYSKPTVY